MPRATTKIFQILEKNGFGNRILAEPFFLRYKIHVEQFVNRVNALRLSLSVCLCLWNAFASASSFFFCGIMLALHKCVRANNVSCLSMYVCCVCLCKRDLCVHIFISSSLFFFYFSYGFDGFHTKKTVYIRFLY